MRRRHLDTALPPHRLLQDCNAAAGSTDYETAALPAPSQCLLGAKYSLQRRKRDAGCFNTGRCEDRLWMVACLRGVVGHAVLCCAVTWRAQLSHRAHRAVCPFECVLLSCSQPPARCGGAVCASSASSTPRARSPLPLSTHPPADRPTPPPLSCSYVVNVTKADSCECTVADAGALVFWE